jgi:putative SOS response-associated peptidase YedK
LLAINLSVAEALLARSSLYYFYMCGRFSLFASAEAAAKYFGAALSWEFGPRYNIAPRQVTPVITSINPGIIVGGCWGLPIDFEGGEKEIINVRQESLAEKPAFFDLVSRSRCLVLADGFYEWKSSGKAKTPYRIEKVDGRPFAMAGVFRFGIVGKVVMPRFAIITQPAANFVAAIHKRMPVIFNADEGKEWLLESKPDRLFQLLQSPVESLRTFPVSRRVNDPADDSEEIIKPAE